MRAVLQIIPTSMFALLAEIIALQTNHPNLRELPTKLEKEKLLEYALQPERFSVARLTHDASVLTQVSKFLFRIRFFYLREVNLRKLDI